MMKPVFILSSFDSSHLLCSPKQPRGKPQTLPNIRNSVEGNAGFGQECDDKEFALAFFHVLESQFAFQFLLGGE